MKITIEEVVNHFKELGKYKTSDVDNYAKELLKKNIDVSPLKEYALQYGFCFRIYFENSLKAIKDINSQLDFIDQNLELFNDWWHTDILLQFLKKPTSFDVIYPRCKDYVNSKLTFVRRLGYVLFLNGAQKETEHFKEIISLYHDDNEYYVQMAEAWLLADLCIFNSDDVVNFIKTCGLKYDILGKAIQKINDSFRISDEIKEKCKKIREIVKNN